MEVKDKYIRRYWHKMVQDQIYDKYKELGYKVCLEYKINKTYTADLYAERESEKVIIEIVTQSIEGGTRERVRRLHEYVKTKIAEGYRFELVVAPYNPLKKLIEFDDLTEILDDYIMNNFPSELDELSTHTTPEYLSDVDISSLIIDKEELSIKGTGIISVNLKYGSGSDSFDSDGSFPFDFELSLYWNDEKWKINENENNLVTCDTSSFDE